VCVSAEHDDLCDFLVLLIGAFFVCVYSPVSLSLSLTHTHIFIDMFRLQIDIYCACQNGELISNGMCDTADYARIELRDGWWM
jgi:hypothetical protein